MQTICGVDISKDWLDVFASSTGAFGRMPNTPDGIEALAAFYHEAGAGLVVMEASGGYEQPAFLGLWAQQIPCAIVNALAVRHFAKAMGSLEKTDRIDAAIIARYALARRIVPTPPRSEDQRQLASLNARMRQITSDFTVNKQRRASTRDAAGRASIAEVIALLTRQHKSISQEIAALIDTDPLAQALDRSLRSVKGVSDRTVATLLADLPEIGTLSGKAIAKLVGLAPIANNSGKREGRHSIRGGRASVRSILYLVADVARRFDQSLTDMRNRLLAQGKPKMVVRIALARKLLVRLNAKARDTRLLVQQSA
jgi:transposase